MPRAVIHALKITAGALGVFLILAALSLGGIFYYFRDSFYPGIRIAGVAAQGLSKQSIEKTLSDKTSSYISHPVVVTLPDISQVKDSVTGEYPIIEIQSTAGELGLQFQPEVAIESAWGVGRQNSPVDWTKAVVPVFFKPKAIALPYSIDETKVQTFIDTQILPKIGVPVPAKIRVDGQTVIIDDPIPGLAVDKEALSQELINTLPSAMDGTVTSYVRAPVTEQLSAVSKAKLQPLADTLDRLGNWSITLQKGEEKIQPKRLNLLAWYAPVQGDDGTMTLAVDSKPVTDYLKAKGGSNLNLTESAKTLNAALTKQLSTIESYPVGRTLPATQIALTIKPEDPKPQAEPDSGNYQLGRFEGKYVEISLKDQKLYRIEGSTLVATYTISSGKWSTPTPKGTFAIREKVPRAYSRTFGLYMPYWMNFVGTSESGGVLPNGAFGLHELPEWPSGYKEGQSHLGTPVSHGCVRLGVGEAAEVYNWVEVGTPVVIH